MTYVNIYLFIYTYLYLAMLHPNLKVQLHPYMRYDYAGYGTQHETNVNRYCAVQETGSLERVQLQERSSGLSASFPNLQLLHLFACEGCEISLVRQREPSDARAVWQGRNARIGIISQRPDLHIAI